MVDLNSKCQKIILGGVLAWRLRVRQLMSYERNPKNILEDFLEASEILKKGCPEKLELKNNMERQSSDEKSVGTDRNNQLAQR